MDGVPQVYQGDVDSFDAHTYYEGLRNGKRVSTSLLNTQLFLTRFSPLLEQGHDIIYIAMSSGISGTYAAARIASMELMDLYPGRFVHVVDSHGCGFGNGLLAVRAAELSRAGVDVRESAAILDAEVPHICQYFTVDDLNFLKRTGRVSGMTAKIATVLNIKPILYGDSSGHIVSCAKVRGRKAAIETVVKKYEEKRIDGPEQRVCISHGDCYADAEKLAELVRRVTPDVPITICQHEPFSGAHVGPGMLALFFRGTER
jgi:DegV family protein with EDD domain